MSSRDPDPSWTRPRTGVVPGPRLKVGKTLKRRYPRRVLSFPDETVVETSRVLETRQGS